MIEADSQVTQEQEQSVKHLVHRTLGTALESITVIPQEDRLRIEVPAGSYAFADVTERLTPRLHHAYYTSRDSTSVELFEPPERADAAGRPQRSGQDIMADIAGRVQAEETALLASVRETLPGASEDFRKGLHAMLREMEHTGPERFIGTTTSPGTRHC